MENVKAKSLVFLVFSCIFLGPLRGKGQPPSLMVNPPAAITAVLFPFPGDEFALDSKPGSSSTTFFPDSLDRVYRQFAIQNTRAEMDSLVLNFSNSIPLAYLYRMDNGQWKEEGRTGTEMPWSRLSLKDAEKQIPFLLPANSVSQFLVCFIRYHHELKIAALVLQKGRGASFQYLEEEKGKLKLEIIQYCFAGFFFAIFMYGLLKFVSRPKDKLYLTYALLNAISGLALTVYFNYPNLESSLLPWYKNSREGCAILSDFTVVLYLLFFRKIMELQVHAPRLFTFISVYIVFHILATVLLPVLAAAPQNTLLDDLYDRSLLFSEFIYVVLNIFFVLYLWPRRTGFYRYLFYGCCVFTTGMTLFFLSSVLAGKQAFIPKDGDMKGYVFMGFFTVAEACCFLTALTQRERQTELINAKYQEELIGQLSASKLLQENFTRDLERQVAERSAQIAKQQKLLEYERQNKLLSDFNRRISETELKALRSQMNPHFIFNSLNSIENFMMKNDKKMASDYFGKFASLIRMILDSSRNEWVPFDKDMEALQLYVELEQLRFDHKFIYRTIIDPAVLSGNCSVPPLLIQPYVENAIIHGLAQSERTGLFLEVRALIDEDSFIYIIEDNGIGRAQSALYQRRNKHSHKSMGMEITQQRIDLINRQTKANGSVSIFDLYDEYENPAGTRVEVKLKCI